MKMLGWAGLLGSVNNFPGVRVSKNFFLKFLNKELIFFFFFFFFFFLQKNVFFLSLSITTPLAVASPNLLGLS